MNIIGILCITLAINTWGKAMFDLDSFPTWANATGVWSWFCLKRWSTRTLPSSSTGTRQKPLVHGTARHHMVDGMRPNAATIWAPQGLLTLTPESCLWQRAVMNMIERRLCEEYQVYQCIYVLALFHKEVTSQFIYNLQIRDTHPSKQPIQETPFKSTPATGKC